jgi:hypothetical protein
MQKIMDNKSEEQSITAVSFTEREHLQNLVGVFNNPIARRSFNDHQLEAIRLAADYLNRAEANTEAANVSSSDVLNTIAVNHGWESWSRLLLDLNQNKISQIIVEELEEEAILAYHTLKQDGSYRQADFIKFSAWFNEEQWRGGKGDINKQMFVKGDWEGVVKRYFQSLIPAPVDIIDGDELL